MEDTRKHRSLVLKFVLPIVLVLPFTFDQVSASVRYAGLPLIALFLGVLGSSVGLSSLSENGILERLSALPVKKTVIVRDYLVANIAMDALQMAAPAAILALSFSIPASSIAIVVAGLLLCLVAANSLGVLMATAASGSGEVHLYSAVCVLGIAGVSGIFFGGGNASMDTIGSALPFGLLKDGLAGMPSGKETIHVIAAGVVSVLLAMLSVALSARLFRARGEH